MEKEIDCSAMRGLSLTNQKKRYEMNSKKIVRVFLSFIGVLFIGLAVGFMRLGNLGADSFSTFNLGLSSFFGVKFGTYMIFSNAIGLILVFLTARHLIGIGTLFNIVLVGYISDFLVHLITSYFGEANSFWLRLLISALGILVLAFGASVYIVAGQGVAPYDALPIIIEEKSKGRVSFQTARVVSDILCISIGFFFGATVGITTIVAGFFMGPIMQFFRTKFTSLLKEFETKKDNHTSKMDSVKI